VLYRATTTLSRARNNEQLVMALESSMNSLTPDLYTAFIVQEPFNINILTSSGDDEIATLQAALIRHDIGMEGFYIQDLQTVEDPDALELDLQAAAGEIRGLAVVPLRIKDTVRGRLLVGYKTPHVFTASERRFMSTLSDGTSVVLDNIVLVDEIQSTLEETTILYQAGRALNNVYSPLEYP
jgi:GAF domain-containing protein